MRKDNPLRTLDVIVATVETKLKNQELNPGEYVRIWFPNSRLPGPVIRVLVRERLHRKWKVHMTEYEIKLKDGTPESGWYMDISGREQVHA